MDISLFNYTLPKQLIANFPAKPRDSSKLLVIDRKTQKFKHDNFYNIYKYLTKNDVLVFNNSKVFPARLFGSKITGGKIELLLLRQSGPTKWVAIHRGKLKVGEKVTIGETEIFIESIDDEIVEINFAVEAHEMMQLIYKFGHTPIPPYIKADTTESELRKDYQTVYAKNEGSAAAPTAGFHFTKSLIKKLLKRGVQMEFVTLHVGLGTFAPIKNSTLEKHKIHSEYFEVDEDTLVRLNKAKSDGKRVICVGTTSLRVLETLAKKNSTLIRQQSDQTSIFIYPPYKFKFVDSLITNFHLPQSTLLALVSAFVSFPNTNENFKSFSESTIGKAYEEAVKNNYRFYSFGDASLIV